jgi:predicted permease
VRSAAAVSHLPLTGREGDWTVEVEGRAEDAAPLPSPNYTFVSEDFFRALGVPVLQGRGFGPADGERTPPVVVVSRSLADALWPGRSPLGRRIRLGGPPDAPPMSWMEVVGVSGDVRRQSLGDAPRPTYYVLDRQTPAMIGSAARSMTVVVRSERSPELLAAPARQAVWALDPELAVGDLRTLDAVVSGSVARPRFAMAVLAAFGAAALALAVIGVYGVLSYAMARRRREMGIRIALGARAAQVRGLVLGAGLRLAAAGVVLGLAGAAAASRVVSALLYEVSGTDPLTFGAAALVLLGAAVAASYLPARRATRVDPAEVLRSE